MKYTPTFTNHFNYIYCRNKTVLPTRNVIRVCLLLIGKITIGTIINTFLEKHVNYQLQMHTAVAKVKDVGCAPIDGFFDITLNCTIIMTSNKQFIISSCRVFLIITEFYILILVSMAYFQLQRQDTKKKFRYLIMNVSRILLIKEQHID